jgi:hypothetical protein
MTSTPNTQTKIIRTERGLTIAGTRITLIRSIAHDREIAPDRTFCSSGNLKAKTISA